MRKTFIAIGIIFGLYAFSGVFYFWGAGRFTTELAQSDASQSSGKPRAVNLETPAFFRPLETIIFSGK
ncbi:MAG: hypothetical protein COV31_02510 [Candidatus Yanofskybacteria bacterium CG10_big_fil_rev_8_21_14_0_10_46_23]|uniref:Uncharacterized protein n=1 Tax=Candidatus Yanofskybacteria bacterium CG10_big_fil_rev_8_21_14_0_10_46_23 TaxID=1975098 RepID=A0A2H0R416_9BACT|nr:MAG: hypothetical protein COV31_02510 [Candidatus Yanofskybacteria bacterium CG10_big_fil_rev_8_21_14_0_10_46_23]